MGQTLSNGVYLPNEGERNCYAGLASNWQILNTAVGNIAEKAPLVHTHGNITNDGKVGTAANKPLITGTDGIVQAGSFGTAANTFCEGNDSRLSDARAPVAHTHTKSDVTDLFNSANTWSGENTFTKPCKTLGKKLLTDITDLDDAYYNGEVCSFNPNTLHSPTGAYGNVLTINNAVDKPDNIYNSWITQIATAPDGSYLGFRNRSNGNAWTSWTSILTESRARPTVTNTYDLGSSSYQWNNLYAKNYYYNGVAWGLDKQNEWTNFQRMTSNPAVWYLRNNTVTLGSTPSSNRYIGMFFEDVNGADLGYASFQANKNSYNSIMFSLRNSDGTNAYTGALRYRASTTGAYCFFPETSECELGISTNKWKTFNGINPGALSLPNVRAAVADLISTVGWNLSGSRNKYTPTEDGWFYIRVAGTGSCAINIHNGDTDNSYPTWFNTSTGGYATLVVPCEKGISLYIYISATSIEYCSFHPCLGNV